MAARGDVRPLEATAARRLENWAWLVMSGVGNLPKVRRRGAMFVLLGLQCGLRISEMASLRWGDFWWDGRESATATVCVQCGKGGKRREVQIAPRLLTALQKWAELNPKPTLDGLLFPSTAAEGEVYATRTVQRDIEKAYEVNGVEGHSAHDLRHTYASYLYVQVRDIGFIQRQLGHDRVETTMRYVASMGAFVAAALENIYGIVEGAQKILKKIGK